MAGFKAHMTGSTLCGIGYGMAGYAYGVPWPTCVVSGLACSVSGMLPDLDSASGKPAKEILCLLAAVVPAMMIPRFRQLGLQHEQAVLAIAGCYILIRYVVGAIFRHYTVHRGMWHSIPAAAVAGLLTFILVHGDTLEIRLYKAVSVVAGFMCHLVMDEIWSIELRNGIPRFKSSFGTALKFYTTINLWSNISTYGKLIALVAFVIGDPYLMKQIGVDQGELPQSTREWLARATEHSQQMYHTLLRHKGAMGNSPTEILESLRGTAAGGSAAPDATGVPASDTLSAIRSAVTSALPDENIQNPPLASPFANTPDSESAMRPAFFSGTDGADRR